MNSIDEIAWTHSFQLHVSIMNSAYVLGAIDQRRLYMETLRQVDLARELGVSDMTIYRLRKATFIHGTTITDRHAVMIFTAFEMQRVGVNAERSCELASRFHSEILYASGGQDRRVWLTFVDDDKHDIVLAAITARQLEAHLATFPLSVTLALHECVQRAVERLSVMRARLAGRAAA